MIKWHNQMDLDDAREKNKDSESLKQEINNVKANNEKTQAEIMLAITEVYEMLLGGM